MTSYLLSRYVPTSTRWTRGRAWLKAVQKKMDEDEAYINFFQER